MNDGSTWSVPADEAIPELTHDQLSQHIRLAKVNPGHYEHIAASLERELAVRSPTNHYKCMKCGHGHHEIHQIRTARSGLGSFFGVETAQYRAVVCARCRFTEFYQGTVPLGQQALDLVFGS